MGREDTRHGCVFGLVQASRVLHGTAPSSASAPPWPCPQLLDSLQYTTTYSNTPPKKVMQSHGVLVQTHSVPLREAGHLAPQSEPRADRGPCRTAGSCFLEEGKDFLRHLGPLLVRLNQHLLVNKPQSPCVFTPTTFKPFSMLVVAFNSVRATHSLQWYLLSFCNGQHGWFSIRPTSISQLIQFSILTLFLSK